MRPGMPDPHALEAPRDCQRDDRGGGRRPWLRPVQCAVWGLLLLSAGACGQDEAVPPSSASADIVGPLCRVERRTLSDSCCPPGSYYDVHADACHEVGPPECAAALYSEPEACTPRWCPSWRDALGKPCPSGSLTCVLEGAPCLPALAAGGGGCPAGYWREPGEAACAAAGVRPPAAASLSTGEDGPDAPLPALVPPAGVPPDDPLPPDGHARFCRDLPIGPVRLCAPGEFGCGPGATPDPDAPGSCLTVGPPWVCPPGFVIDTEATPTPDRPAPCLPDPSRCGDDPWGGEPDGPGVVHVAAAAPPGGDGSRAKPLQSLAAGVTLAPDGGAVLVSDGTYGALKVSRVVRISGRCAAKVRVEASGADAAVLVQGGSPQSDPDAGVELRGMTLRGALGILARGPVPVRAVEVLLVDAETAGAVADGPAATLTLERVLALRCGKGFGIGLLAQHGGRLQVQDVRVSGAQMSGVGVNHALSTLLASRLMVDDTRAVKGVFGFGLTMEEGGVADVTSARIVGNQNAGVLVAGQGTRLSLIAARVESTGRADKSDAWSAGIGVTEGGRADLTAVRVRANVGSGVHVESSGSVLRAHGLLIDDNRHDPAHDSTGVGLHLRLGARVELDSARVSANRSEGIVAFHVGTSLVARGLLVDATAPYPEDQSMGLGVDIAKGAGADLQGVRVSRNHTIGLRAIDPGTRVWARDLLVDRTAPRAADDAMGLGVHVGAGATLHLSASRVSANHVLGVRAADPDTELRLQGTLVDATRASAAHGRWGTGVDVQLGARAWLSGSRLSGNRMAGAVVAAAGRLSLLGCQVDHTQVEQAVSRAGGLGGGLGVGVWAIDEEARLQITSSLMRANRGAGVAVSRARAQIDGSAITQTVATVLTLVKPGGSLVDATSKELADGIVADHALELVVERSLIASQERAGLLMEGGAGRFVRSVATGGAFGIALQGDVALEEQESLLFANLQNHVGKQLLFVPAAPVIGAP